MIVELKDTTTSKIGKKLQELRETGGVVALGRVLSLIVETDAEHLEDAVRNANGASKLHPSRIIVIAKDQATLENKLDAEIRVGGDAGASEVIILRSSGYVLSNIESLVNGLLLPDAPVVAWWPGECSSNPAATDIGKIASRRITDSSQQVDSISFLRELARNYTPGDGDTAWTRITLWRSQLAALLDSHLNRQINQITLIARNSSPSAHLLAKWLGLRLKVPVTLKEDELSPDSDQAIEGIVIAFDDGSLQIRRQKELARISQPSTPDSTVLLPQRSDLDCLVEDLRFLGEDLSYAQVLEEFRK
jgi:glucose-6-phosphate dehydrogenase assembly protein OpcA